ARAHTRPFQTSTDAFGKIFLFLLIIYPSVPPFRTNWRSAFDRGRLRGRGKGRLWLAARRSFSRPACRLGWTHLLLFAKTPAFMNILILAAGYATRLYPLTLTKAKPLLDVCGKPMMEWVIDNLAPIEGIEKVFVVTNSKFAADFQAWADSYHAAHPKLA